MPSFVTGLFNVPANFRTVVSGVGETSFDGPVSNLIRLPASTSAWRGSSSFLRFTRNTVAILETLRFYFLQRQTGDSGGSVFFETLGYCLPLTRYAPLYLKNGLPTLCRILQFHNLTNSAVSATLLNPSEEHRTSRRAAIVVSWTTWTDWATTGAREIAIHFLQSWFCSDKLTFSRKTLSTTFLDKFHVWPILPLHPKYQFITKKSKNLFGGKKIFCTYLSCTRIALRTEKRQTEWNVIWLSSKTEDCKYLL